LKIKSEKDFWSGLMFVLVGIAFAWGATAYNFGTSARPGPGYFPFGLGILLAVLGSVVLFTALTIEVEGGDRVGAFAWKPILAILSAVVLTGFALPKLGLALSLPILIGVSSIAGEEFHWREVIINCIVLTVGSWAIFIKGLGLTIPLWPVFVA
jgi:Tripartite tricarboxylate transporter TctB family